MLIKETITETTVGSLQGAQVAAANGMESNYESHNGQVMYGPTMLLVFLEDEEQIRVGKGSSVHVAGRIWHVTKVKLGPVVENQLGSFATSEIELSTDLRKCQSLAVDLSEILESLTYVLALCKQWIHREPDIEDLATVYRTAALAEIAAEVVPEAYRAQPRRPMILKNFLDRRRSVSPLGQASLAESELHRSCSLHLVDLAGVTDDDMVFEMTDHYFGQNYELAPWDTWVWREGNYLVSWVPVWMKERLNTGIVSESAGAHSWLRVNYDNRLEIVGFSESGL